MRERVSVTEPAAAPRRTEPPASQGAAGELLALQAAAGNAAVGRMLARRESLSISVPAAMAGDDRRLRHERTESTPFVREEGEDASGVSQSDIHQGAVGDCYFLSPLMALSRINPGRIARMIRRVRTEDDGRVIYEVTIHAPVGGSWEQRGFLLDDRFVMDAAGDPRYAGYGDTAVGGAREIWVMLMEKAWAAAKGSYQDIHFGNAEHGLRAVTGHGGSWTSIASRSADDIVADIERAIADGRPVICNTPRSFNAAQNRRATELGLRLVPSHSYNASWASTRRSQLDIRNPHGINHLIDLDASDFRLFFEWYLIADHSAR